MTTWQTAIAVWTALVLGYILGAIPVLPGAGLVTITVVWVIGIMALVIARAFGRRG